MPPTCRTLGERRRTPLPSKAGGFIEWNMRNKMSQDKEDARINDLISSARDDKVAFNTASPFA